MEKEPAKKRSRSRIAIFAFVLSLIPILLLIFYGIIRDLLFNSPLIFILWYNLIVEVIPFVSLLFSIIAIILIRKRGLKGMGLAVTGLVISLIEGVLFLLITTKIAV